MHGFGRSLYNQQIEYGVMISRDIDKSVLKRNLEREKEIKRKKHGEPKTQQQRPQVII